MSASSSKFLWNGQRRRYGMNSTFQLALVPLKEVQVPKHDMMRMRGEIEFDICK